MERHVLSVLVRNSSGVLTRVSGLFARRGFNIDSLTVGKSRNIKNDYCVKWKRRSIRAIYEAIK